VSKINLDNILEVVKGNFSYHVTGKFKQLPPKHFTINVTYRCNAKCKMCNIWKYGKKDELTLQEIEGILQDPIFHTVEDLAINGGEATLRKDVVDIVALSIKNMKSLSSITYNTNGLLTDKIINNVKQIAAICNDRDINFTIYISLDGVGRIHDEIRGVEGAFERASTTILKLKKIKNEYGFHIGTSCVLNRINIEHIDELEKWRETEGLSQSYILIGFHDAYVHNLDRMNDVGFNDRASQEKLLKVIKRLAENKSLTNFSAYYWYDMYNMITKGKKRRSLCPLIMEGAAFDAYGDVYYCLSEQSVGNLKDGTFSEIYYSEKAREIKSKIMKERCPQCESGCMVDIGVRNNIFSYLKFLCLKNKYEAL